MKKLTVYIMLLAVMPLLMILGGCKKDMKNQASNMQFKLMDAPAAFDALNIDIKGIQAHTQAGGWVTLPSSLGVTNILTYVNGNTALIAEGSLPAGTIDQVKLMLGSNNSVVVNGTTFSLSAAAMQSGLTINLNNELQAGGSYTWTIDFDAAQSVTASGSGSFQLNPVLRLIVDPLSLTGNAGVSGSGNINTGTTGTGSGNISIGTGGTGSGSIVINGSTTGNISGSITGAGLASVCATGSNGSSVCTMTNLSGQFSLQAMGTGSYSVTITPMVSLSLGGSSSAHTVSNVSVTAGQTTNIGVVTM